MAGQRDARAADVHAQDGRRGDRVAARQGLDQQSSLCSAAMIQDPWLRDSPRNARR
jgi:hypothetical protein